MEIATFKIFIWWYIVGYMVGNYVLRLRWRVAENKISDHITDGIPPKIKIWIQLSPKYKQLKTRKSCKAENKWNILSTATSN